MTTTHIERSDHLPRTVRGHRRQLGRIDTAYDHDAKIVQSALDGAIECISIVSDSLADIVTLDDLCVYLYMLFEESLSVARLEEWVTRLDVTDEYERLTRA